MNNAEMKLKYKVLKLAVRRTRERYYEEMERLSRIQEADPGIQLDFPKYPDLAQIEDECKALFNMIN